MAERASIFQGIQLFPETTAGTSGAATKRLGSMSIEPSIKYEGQTFTPKGNKFSAVQSPNKEWTEAKVSGTPTYNELVYALSGVLQKVTPTTEGTLGKRWTYVMNNASADTLQTYTIEQGDAVRAHKMSYGTFKEFGITFARNGFSISGMLFGQRLVDNITMTASPTMAALIPVLPTQMSLKVASTQAGLAGATKLARPLTAEWKIADRIAPLWVLNDTYPSWAATVETQPKVTGKIKMEADAEGMGILAYLRSGDTIFTQYACLGGELESGTNYELVIEQANKVTNVSEFTDQDGVYAVEWDLEATYDTTWAKAFQVDVVNTLASL